MVYLHSRIPPIAHRDLSAKNILVDNGLNAKIADMSVSRIVKIQPGRLATSMTQMPGTGVYTCHQRQLKRKGSHDTTLP